MPENKILSTTKYQTSRKTFSSSKAKYTNYKEKLPMMKQHISSNQNYLRLSFNHKSRPTNCSRPGINSLMNGATNSIATSRQSAWPTSISSMITVLLIVKTFKSEKKSESNWKH